MHDQKVRPRCRYRMIGRRLHTLKQSEQREGHRYLKKDQERPATFAQETGPDERQKFHPEVKLPASILLCGFRTTTSRWWAPRV